tara:strand:- start:351 stop:473 length:123 start_codon:yes stop_codon:yes gene_type:complete
MKYAKVKKKMLTQIIVVIIIIIMIIGIEVLEESVKDKIKY